MQYARDTIGYVLQSVVRNPALLADLEGATLLLLLLPLLVTAPCRS